MEVFWQQMNSLPLGFTGIGMQYLMVTALALVAGGLYKRFRDLVQHRERVPAAVRADATRRKLKE